MPDMEAVMRKRHKVAKILVHEYSSTEFEHWLGEAMFRADLENQARIEREWQEYWVDIPDWPDEEEVRKVRVMMLRYGGGFASQLGKALQCSSSYQAMRVKRAWPELWQQYLEMAEKQPDLLAE